MKAAGVRQGQGAARGAVNPNKEAGGLGPLMADGLHTQATCEISVSAQTHHLHHRLVRRKKKYIPRI